MFTLRPFHYAVIIFAAAITATGISMHVGVRADRVAALNKQMKIDESRIQLLNTELAYLASPQRIQALVGTHRPDLNTPKTEQYLMSVSALLPQIPERQQPSVLISMHDTEPVAKFIMIPRRQHNVIPASDVSADMPITADIMHTAQATRLNADTIATVQLAASHDLEQTGKQ